MRTRRDPEARARSAEAHARLVNTDAAYLIAADAWEEAGDASKARLMVALQPSVIAARERAYREDELRRQRAEEREIERSWRSTSRQDRASAIDDAVQYLENDPEILEERTDWTLNGTMGAGWMYRAQEIARASKRQNRAAQLFRLVTMVDNRLPESAITQVWHRLSPAARNNVTHIMQDALEIAEREARGASGLGT